MLHAAKKNFENPLENGWVTTSALFFGPCGLARPFKDWFCTWFDVAYDLQKKFWKSVRKRQRYSIKLDWAFLGLYLFALAPILGLLDQKNTLNVFSSLRAICQIKNFQNRTRNGWVMVETLLKRPFWTPSGGLFKKWRPKQHGHGIWVPSSENSSLIALSV